MQIFIICQCKNKIKAVLKIFALLLFIYNNIINLFPDHQRMAQRMAYLNAQQLQKSILGKSVIASDPIRIQQTPNLQNVPGIKIKSTTEEWIVAENCTICKQPFSTERSVNRHHCRICGLSVCGECSRKKINGERSCDLCFLKQCLKKQEHQRKQQFRLREQNIEKMNEEIKQFQIDIEKIEKEIELVEKTNIELKIKLNKQATQRQQQLERRQEECKKKQEELQKKKQVLQAKKQQLDSREDRNKTYYSKVQVIKLDISSKQNSLLEKMEELERLKNQLEKLESQRKQLMAQFK